uniref:Temptin n=1 Tax=Steinernema glaseri TaxID=37863 RepID=A0A1I8AFS4_9BILA
MAFHYTPQALCYAHKKGQDEEDNFHRCRSRQLMIEGDEVPFLCGEDKDVWNDVFINDVGLSNCHGAEKVDLSAILYFQAAYDKPVWNEEKSLYIFEVSTWNLINPQGTSSASGRGFCLPLSSVSIVIAVLVLNG